MRIEPFCCPRDPSCPLLQVTTLLAEADSWAKGPKPLSAEDIQALKDQARTDATPSAISKPHQQMPATCGIRIAAARSVTKSVGARCPEE